MSDCPKLTTYNSRPQLITFANQRMLRLSNYSLTSGTSVKLSCVNNFHLVGQSNVVCNDGKWNFGAKPYCGDAGSAGTSSTSGSLTDETKILIGVLVGVLGAVILVILTILCIIESRIRRRREEKKSLTKHGQGASKLDDLTVGKNNPGYWSEDVTYRPPSYSRAHIPGIFAVPLQRREYPFRKPLSEPDYGGQHTSGRQLGSRSLHSADSDISAYNFYRPASRNMTDKRDNEDFYKSSTRFQKRDQSRDLPPLPPGRPMGKDKSNKRSVASEPLPKRENRYVGNWITRDSIKACKGFNERALLHGRDPFLWKKVDNNWGVHLTKPDLKADDFFD